jgi:hypothetical protein
MKMWLRALCLVGVIIILHSSIKISLGQNQCPPAVPTVAGLICPEGNGLFVLYYGSDTDVWQHIWMKQPNFVVVGDTLQKRKDMPVLFHHTDATHRKVLVLAYVRMKFGKLSSKKVDGQVCDAMQAGYDGIFFDETNDKLRDWNSARARLVKSYGNKLVIMNPGKQRVDGSIFDYADIVSVENAYGQSPIADPQPATPIPTWRWLSVQGDPQKKDEYKAPSLVSDALARMATFRSLGGFWYYTSEMDKKSPLRPTHIFLPSWFDEFADAVSAQGSPSCLH